MMDLSMWQIVELAHPELSDAKRIFVFGYQGDFIVLFNDNKTPCLLHGSSLVKVSYPEDFAQHLLQAAKLYRDKHVNECSADFFSHIVLSTEYRSFSFCFAMPNKRYEDDSPYLHAVPNIYKVACGKEHTVIINDKGKTCIYESFEEFLKKNDRVPTYDLFMKKTVGGLLDDVMAEDVACGFAFTVVVDSDGVVYSWGYNHRGQLGIGTIHNESMPVMVPINDSIASIACGTSHVLALSTTGNLYTWGSNWFGELGYRGEQNFSSKPIMLTSGVSEILAVHNSRMSAAKVGSKVYIWGNVRGHAFHNPALTTYNDINVPFALLSIPAVTPKVAVLQSTLACTMKKHLKDCFDDQKTSDVKFEVDQKFLYAHQRILRLRCIHFITLFQENVTNDSDGKKVIKIFDYSYEDYKVFLKYFYTDEVEQDMSIDLIASLCKLSDNYNQRNLQHTCRKMFIGEISVDTVGQCYIVAKRIKDKVLVDACAIFAANNKTAIIQSKWFQELEDCPYDFLDAMIECKMNFSPNC